MLTRECQAARDEGAIGHQPPATAGQDQRECTETEQQVSYERERVQLLLRALGGNNHERRVSGAVANQRGGAQDGPKSGAGVYQVPGLPSVQRPRNEPGVLRRIRNRAIGGYVAAGLTAGG